MSSVTVDTLKFNNTPMQTSSSEQATKADIIELRKDMAEMKSELFKAMMLQVFAISGLVVAVIKFMQT
jgi:lipopolysaccharide/colanic/teichoic acid biosynthesis glycosyltransferase